MILGNVCNMDTKLADCDEAVKKALLYLKEQDFTKMPDGKYEIDGDKIYAKVQRYTTKPVEKCRPEAHKKYIDVQFIAEGQEEIGWCADSPDLVEVEDYDGRDDVVFFAKLVPESSVVLKTGDFAVLYPSDIHRPQAAVEGEESEVIKVVVKVAVDLLKK